MSILAIRWHLSQDPKWPAPSHNHWSTLLTTFLPVCDTYHPNFWMMRGSLHPMHLFINSCKPLATFLSRRNFIHVSKEVVIIKGSLSDSGWSLLPGVEISMKLPQASRYVSLSPLEFRPYAPMAVPLLNTMSTLGSPHRVQTSSSTHSGSLLVALLFFHEFALSV